jgi:predicted TPR repeat methyltransferase
LLPDSAASAGVWNNLGNVLLEGGELADAAEAYQRSVALAPAVARTWVNLSTLLRRQGRFDESAQAAQRATGVDDQDAEAWYALSRARIEAGDIAAGLVAHSHAVLRWPRQIVLRDQVLRALQLLGEHARAAALYREWLAEEPDNPVARHQLAACGGVAMPERASDAYVQTVFDSYASSFDAKLATLGYAAPGHVAQAVAQVLPQPDARCVVADLGCGTGLCAPLLRPWAAQLVGCDLSAAMLKQAERRGLYDQLVHGELTAFLHGRRLAFDLLVAADTLCYFGDLRALAVAAAAALRPGGHIVFTVEASNDGDVVLQPNGRYAHGRSHVEAALRASGFGVMRCDRRELRQEAGRAVAGDVVTAQLDN